MYRSVLRLFKAGKGSAVNGGIEAAAISLCVQQGETKIFFFHHFVICCTSNSVTKPTLKQLDCVEECEKLVCAFILITLEPF